MTQPPPVLCPIHIDLPRPHLRQRDGHGHNEARKPKDVVTVEMGDEDGLEAIGGVGNREHLRRTTTRRGGALSTEAMEKFRKTATGRRAFLPFQFLIGSSSGSSRVFTRPSIHPSLRAFVRSLGRSFVRSRECPPCQWSLRRTHRLGLCAIFHVACQAAAQ